MLFLLLFASLNNIFASQIQEKLPEQHCFPFKISPFATPPHVVGIKFIFSDELHIGEDKVIKEKGFLYEDQRDE